MRKILRVLAFAFVLALPSFANAQKVEFDNLKVNVVMPENENISDNLLSSLQDRLYEAVSLNALGSTDGASRFVLLPIVNVVSKNATTSIPPQFVAEIEVALYFADNQEKTIISQTVITKKGMADTENKAVAKALKSVQARDKKIKRLFDEGKANLAKYFATHTDEAVIDTVGVKDVNWILEN